MSDKRYYFLVGMLVGGTTWSISLYFYWVLSTVNQPTQTDIKPASTFKYADDIIMPYEAKVNPHKGAEKYYRQNTRLGLNKVDADRQKLQAIKIGAGSDDDPGRVRNLDDLQFRDEGYKNHGFNTLVSRNLDYHRAIPDTRHALCRNQSYPLATQSTSVIICFYNEDFNTLIRSLHSLMDRTPKSLLREIILVDDYSDSEGLHDSVAKYIEAPFLTKVQFFRTARREGLIRARLFGAEKASADVLVFLDSHIEANMMWLEPLLHRIAGEETRVVTPIIDIINSDTFKYTPSPLVRGGFNWGLHFKWINVPSGLLARDKDFIKAITSPTMAGGLFAISRNYFYKLGAYDAGMDIWGGENLEMSFRVWQCGGSIEIIPCSRIGHVFRKHRPYGSPDGKDTMLRNSLRVANVWMDEYKDKFYHQRPEAVNIQYGDIKSRLELKKTLNCKPFSWYIQHVFPELTQPGEGDSPVGAKLDSNNEKGIRRNRYIAHYNIRLSGTNLCVSSEKDVKTKGSKLILRSCLRIKNQLWSETEKGELKLAQYLCMDVQRNSPILGKCHEMGGTQEWKHKASSNMAIYNPAAGTCLSAVDRTLNSHLSLGICNPNNRSQWDFVPVSL